MGSIYMSTEQAAEACGLSVRHFNRVIQELGIQPATFGRRGRTASRFYTPLQMEAIRNARVKVRARRVP